MQMEIETRPDHFKGPVTVGDYVLKSKLRKGSFSIVWKVEHRLSNQEVALKQVYPSRLNRQLKICFDSELNFLSSIYHPHIVRLCDVF
ncbi:hypothetical protein CIPAW_03G124800 [Carya illinoinensis]|uniref:Protein kinase domain-containing protein n=1 Tax=Carya illinoinensis TaxID=32201 RepID=A0A8T1R3N7_CARIL|nr:hypothetical protein CIPAW_03G124800 [Carya illinoinensis]